MSETWNGRMFTPGRRPEKMILLFSSFALLAPALGDPPALVQVINQGKSDWHIATAGGAEGSWAAGELTKYLRLMSGAELPIGTDTPLQPGIALGLRDHLPESCRRLLPPPAKGHDGYAIAVVPGSESQPERIVIGGDNGPGLIYGVYDLLERFGCRWFYPAQNPNDPEVVPRKSTLRLSVGSWAVASPLKYRICNGSSWFFDMDLAAAAAQLDWAMKNRFNAIGWQCVDKDTVPLIDQYENLRKAGLLEALARRGLMLHGPAHSFQHFLRAEDHMAEHPEWFGLRGGKRVPQNFFGAQFCWSNAGARRQFIDNLERFVVACPQIRILAVVPFDGGPACECPECRRIGASNALMVLMREVIERLETSAPTVLVETVGGYGAASDPPAGADIHPRQRIIWAHWGRYYGSGYDDPRYDRKANLEAWLKAAGGGLTVCQYYTDNFAEPWILPPFAIALLGDRRYFLEQGVESVYLLMWSPGYWWNHGLNGYLSGRCFYDASLDPYALIEDYGHNYYGPTAGPLIAAYYQQWAREIELAYRVRDDSLPRHWKMLADQRRKWIDPAVAAVQSDPLLAARVARVEKLHTLAERLCEVHRRRYEIQRLRHSGEFEQAAARLEAARIYSESVLYLFYALADLDQGLIERKDIGWFIKIKVRDWADAEAKAIAEKNRRVEGPPHWREVEEPEPKE